MFPIGSSMSIAVRAAACAAVLAGPAAAGVTVALDPPGETLRFNETFRFQAEVAGADGDEVLWSASEVTGEGQVLRFRDVWPGDPAVRFRPDPGTGTATFMARAAGAAVRTFQVRAASRRQPTAFACITFRVEDGPGPGAGEQIRSSVPPAVGWGGEAKATAARARGPEVRARTLQIRGLPGHPHSRFVARAASHAGSPPSVLGTIEDMVGAWGVQLDLGRLDLATGKVEQIGRGASLPQFMKLMAAHPDGSILADDATGNRILRIQPERKLEVVTGTRLEDWDEDRDSSWPGADLFVGGLAVLDRAAVYLDLRRNEIRRATAGQPPETLAGGGPATAVYPRAGQDLRLPRPASSVSLPGLVNLYAAPDGRLVFTCRGDGIFALAPDGVLHRLTGASHGGLVAVTTDNRVVFRRDGVDLWQLDPGAPDQEPLLLARGQSLWPEEDNPALAREPLVTTTTVPLGSIQRIVPAPEGCLLVQTVDCGHAWLVFPPYWDDALERAVAAAVAAAGAGDVGRARRLRDDFRQAAQDRPGHPGPMPAFQVRAVSKQGLPRLPGALLPHVQSFLPDPERLRRRARIGLHVLEARIGRLPAETRAAFAAGRPGAGAAPDGAERKAGGDSGPDPKAPQDGAAGR